MFVAQRMEHLQESYNAYVNIYPGGTYKWHHYLHIILVADQSSLLALAEVK